MRASSVVTVVPQFTEYSYSGSLAAGAYFTPPAKTIILTAEFQVVDKLELWGTYGIIQIASGGESGFIGALYCDGAGVRFKNTDVAAQLLMLFGVSMA